MNKYNRAVINGFLDSVNVGYIKQKLNAKFKNPNVYRYLEDGLNFHITEFAQQIEQDWLYTDPITSMYGNDNNVPDQIACLNMMFIEHMIDLIDNDLLERKKFHQLTNNETWAVNDKLNATNKTIIGGLPRSKLCDTDTRNLDDPLAHYIANKRDPNGTIEGINGTGAQSFALQVQPNSAEKVHGSLYGGPNNAAKSPSSYSELAPSADRELNDWWYPRRGAEVRDDPVGELNRDRAAPKMGRNQVEFPYGNAGGWRSGYNTTGLPWEPNGSFDWDHRGEIRPTYLQKRVPGNPDGLNPAESRCLPYSGHNNYINGGTTAGDLRAGQPSYVSGPDSSERGVSAQQTLKAAFPCNKEHFVSGAPSVKAKQPINDGNSLCAYKPATMTIGDGYSYQGAPDSHERGIYQNKFTGNDAENSDKYTDRLLGTPYIQTLNEQYGESARPHLIQSTFERGKYGAKQHITHRPQNNTKLWHNGDGFMDQSNDKEMAKLIKRRVFRSYNYGCTCCALCISGKKCKCGSHKIVPHGDSAAEQIPWYERALYNRYYERDVEEAMGGFEMDGLNRGYGKDMMSLYCRVPNNYPCGASKKRLPGGYNNQEGVDWKFYWPK